MCVTALCHARLGAPPTGPPSFGSCAICRAKEDGKTEPNSRSQVTSKKLRTVVKIYKEQVVWTTGVLFFCHNSWRLCKFANLWPFIFLRHLFLWFLSFGSLDRRTFTIHCEGASKEQSLDQFLKSNKASPRKFLDFWLQFHFIFSSCQYLKEHGLSCTWLLWVLVTSQ